VHVIQDQDAAGGGGCRHAAHRGYGKVIVLRAVCVHHAVLAVGAICLGDLARVPLVSVLHLHVHAFAEVVLSRGWGAAVARTSCERRHLLGEVLDPRAQCLLGSVLHHLVAGR
jgi:hypothetical protein